MTKCNIAISTAYIDYDEGENRSIIIMIGEIKREGVISEMWTIKDIIDCKGIWISWLERQKPRAWREQMIKR